MDSLYHKESLHDFQQQHSLSMTLCVHKKQTTQNFHAVWPSTRERMPLKKTSVDRTLAFPWDDRQLTAQFGLV